MSESLAEQVTVAWRRARERAEAAGRPVTYCDDLGVDDPIAAWEECVENLRTAFAQDWGDEAVTTRFRVPPDYDAFRRIEGRYCESLAEPACFLCNTRMLYAEPAEKIYPLRDDGFWVTIGEGASQLQICFDSRHPLFGAVVCASEYASPYRAGVPSATWRVAAPSWLAFLECAEGFRPPDNLPAPDLPPEPVPVPTHLSGWVAGATFEDEELRARVRCPCGNERVELRCLGETIDGRPRVVEIEEGYYFIVEAACVACGAQCVLFDQRFHGCEGFLQYDADPNEPPPRRPEPWSCVACGGSEHLVDLQIIIDYMDRYFEYGHHRRFGIHRWMDAFGWIDIGIECCHCGHRTGWVSLETR